MLYRLTFSTVLSCNVFVFAWLEISVLQRLRKRSSAESNLNISILILRSLMILYYGLPFATSLAGTMNALCADLNVQINHSINQSISMDHLYSERKTVCFQNFFATLRFNPFNVQWLLYVPTCSTLKITLSVHAVHVCVSYESQNETSKVGIDVTLRRVQITTVAVGKQ
jgi:hypothetical protein